MLIGLTISRQTNQFFTLSSPTLQQREIIKADLQKRICVNYAHATKLLCAQWQGGQKEIINTSRNYVGRWPDENIANISHDIGYNLHTPSRSLLNFNSEFTSASKDKSKEGNGKRSKYLSLIQSNISTISTSCLSVFQLYKSASHSCCTCNNSNLCLMGR